jgi:hypothetical protein
LIGLHGLVAKKIFPAAENFVARGWNVAGPSRVTASPASAASWKRAPGK